MEFSDDTRALLDAVNPTHDEIQREMAAHADEHHFPIIGREAGGLLRSIAQVSGARRVFEFGSGFGYSAYWFLQGMPADGEVVLTEFDADEIELAREFFERAGVDDRAHFERGDAMDVAARYEGPFDAVLIDHRKDMYPEAFEEIREKVPEGGVVIADNVVRSSVAEHYGSDDESPADDRTRGLVEYLETVRAAPEFDTVLLPVGNGIALSAKTA